MCGDQEAKPTAACVIHGARLPSAACARGRWRPRRDDIWQTTPAFDFVNRGSAAFCLARKPLLTDAMVFPVFSDFVSHRHHHYTIKRRPCVDHAQDTEHNFLILENNPRLWYGAHKAAQISCYARPEICKKGGHVVNHQNVTPEIRSKQVPRKAVIVLLITVCILLVSLLVLQTMRLQREQERVSVAEATVDRAQELLDLADGDLEQYCATVREYYAEKNHPVFAKIKPQDYSEIFAAYQKWHPMPDPLLGSSTR